MTGDMSVPKMPTTIFFAEELHDITQVPLTDTMRIPRPCAYKSTNITSVQYYRGQNALNYDIGDQNEIVTTSEAHLLFQNGTDTAGLATLNNNNGTVTIQTDDESHIGVQKMIIRSCPAND